MSKKYLFSAFTKKPKNPFSIIIKESRHKDTLYITYSNGPANGGGTWGEDLRFLNDRTIDMIEDIFSESVFEKFRSTVLQRIQLRERKNEI